MSGNSQKRTSLSIHLPSSNPGPRPLQLVNTPLSVRYPEGSLLDSPNTASLQTPPIASSPNIKRLGSARRQSSISYNPSSAQASRRSSSYGPPSPAMVSPAVESTPEEIPLKRAPTMMELHSSMLAQIAQREQRSLELKAALESNEDELTNLKRQWTELIATTSPHAPLSPTVASSMSVAALAKHHNVPVPNIADPFYGMTSPTFNGLLQEGAKGVSRFLSSFAVPATPEHRPHSASMVRSKSSGSFPHAPNGLPSNLKRKASNRDSASSSGSGTSASTTESRETEATSVEFEDDKPLIDFGDEEEIGNSTSTSLSRHSSVNRRRSRQIADGSMLPSFSEPTTFSSPSPPVTAPNSGSTRSAKRHTISPIQSVPGLGLAGVVGGLFASDKLHDHTALTLSPKRQSTGTAPLSSSPQPGHNKRKSNSILGGFNWNDMLAPTSRSSTPGLTTSTEPKKSSPGNSQSEMTDEWNW